jgi:cytochrome c-type biogenesis protein CcmF
MNTTKFIGEQLLPGQIGYFLTILTLVASLLATFAFAKAFFSKELATQNQWNKLAKIAFYIEAVAVFSCFIVLFYIISKIQYIKIYFLKIISLHLNYILRIFSKLHLFPADHVHASTKIFDNCLLCLILFFSTFFRY